MAPPPSPSGALRHWVHVVIVVVIVGVLAATLVTTPGAVAQQPPTMPGVPLGPNQLFGLGAGDPLGTMTPGGAWAIVGSAHHLDQFDPLTGAMMGDHAGHMLSMDAAVVQDLAAADQLAFDARMLAERARAEAEAKKRAAQADAAKRGVSFDRRPSKGVAADWELKNFSSCGSSANTSKKSRIEMVDAWEEMCQAAARDGVNLVVTSAFRDPAHQRRLWNEALAKYGSAAVARKWVAQPRADGSCSSRHCTGEAIDVSQQGGTGAWMHATVGCWSNGAMRHASSCGSGERRVKRAQLFGFVFPMDHEPWHIELGIPVAGIGASAGGDCNPPGSLSVPQMIGEIWRCRLSAAGITGAERDRIVAEALVVSKCESGWNPGAIAFGGRYVSTPHPSTGSRYTAAGVFQFIRATANAWIDGGYANVHDPVKNIDAAARLWLSTKKWNAWECAVGGRFHGAKGVLPQHGGPALPDWAKQY